MTAHPGPIVKDRIVAHLVKHPERDDYLASTENTALGIAAGTGVSRAHADVVLKQLQFEGRVRVRLGRVSDRKKRANVFFSNDRPDQPPNKTCSQLLEVAYELDRLQKLVHEMIGGSHVR